MLLDRLLERFANLIDEIGAHRVAGIAVDVQDQHRTAVGARELTHGEIAHAASAGHEARQALVGEAISLSRSS